MVSKSKNSAVRRWQDRIDTQQSPGKVKGHNRMTAEKIKRVEEPYRKKLHDPGRIDGIIDHRTRDALREFQKLNNLPVTGVLDEQTAFTSMHIKVR
jgi:peptidoglycan hydrolase-like protein with peptidoglycan-binding domain